MRRKILLVQLMVVVIALLCIYKNRQEVQFTEDTSLYLLENNQTSELVYETGLYNTMVCDLATLSNICDNMADDGYVVEIVEETDTYINLMISNDTEVHRIQWYTDQSLTTISSPYEKSYVPMSYINESKD